MMNEMITTARPLEVIEAELDLLEKDTRQKETALIENYIEVGRRLEEAKAQLDHGQWGPWLEKRGYPQPKAIKLMKVFRAYGTEQQSLFGGEAKSKAFSNLGFHKLVQLLAIEDEGEREDFVAAHDVDHMSTRELQKTLQARSAEMEKAVAQAKAAEDARAKMEHDMQIVNESLKDQRARMQSLQTEADQSRDMARKLQDALSSANAAAQAAEEEHARLIQELEELRSRPVDVAVEVDTEAVEAARKAAIAEMTEKVDKAKKARKEAEKALAAAKRELDDLKSREPEVRELTQAEKDALTAGAVEAAMSAERERIAAMEKQLAMADGDTAAFKVHFDAWLDAYGKMMGYLERITGRDPEKAGKLRCAVKTGIERMEEGCK